MARSAKLKLILNSIEEHKQIEKHIILQLYSLNPNEFVATIEKPTGQGYSNKQNVMTLTQIVIKNVVRKS